MCHNATSKSMKILVYNSLLSADVGLAVVLCVLFGSFADSVFFNKFLELWLCLFLQLFCIVLLFLQLLCIFLLFFQLPFFKLLPILLFLYCLVLSVTTIAFCKLT